METARSPIAINLQVHTTLLPKRTLSTRKIKVQNLLLVNTMPINNNKHIETYKGNI